MSGERGGLLTCFYIPKGTETQTHSKVISEAGRTGEKVGKIVWAYPLFILHLFRKPLVWGLLCSTVTVRSQFYMLSGSSSTHYLHVIHNGNDEDPLLGRNMWEV